MEKDLNIKIIECWSPLPSHGPNQDSKAFCRKKKKKECYCKHEELIRSNQSTKTHRNSELKYNSKCFLKRVKKQQQKMEIPKGQK